jgi:hypothetical protein
VESDDPNADTADPRKSVLIKPVDGLPADTTESALQPGLFSTYIVFFSVTGF